MRKKFLLSVTAAVVTAISVAAIPGMTAFAGTWQKDETGWWWQNDDGSYPANEWVWIDGDGNGTAESYCFDEKGYLYCGTVTPDGYEVNQNGAWVSDGVVQTQPISVLEQTQELTDEERLASLVPIDQLVNLKSLKKKCTDAEFQAAYDAATPIVAQAVGMSTEQQLIWIARVLRRMADSGQVSYSMSADHYNDPYGYFVLGVGSCAGSTRATGLCLNMLGIPYEHVNENQYSHQWCRVNVNGTYWICDAYGLYVGPEPAPYEHPNFSPEYSDGYMAGKLVFLF